MNLGNNVCIHTLSCLTPIDMGCEIKNNQTFKSLYFYLCLVYTFFFLVNCLDWNIEQEKHKLNVYSYNWKRYSPIVNILDLVMNKILNL